MSTELKPTKDMNSETIFLTQFWGGPAVEAPLRRSASRPVYPDDKSGWLYRPEPFSRSGPD